MSEPPAFPGAIGVSHLRVYDSTSPDGLAGGTPHLHTVCTEAYFVVRGEGSVQTISRDGFRETDLDPGAFVWFTPGTVHRLVNRGDLEILVLMQNAGLPEAGDMVITFDPATRATAETYALAATLPEEERTTSGTGEAARQRRDAAVRWFGKLRAAVERGDRAPLERLYADAARLVADYAAEWRQVWKSGPMAEAERTGSLIDAIEARDPAHLADATVSRLPPHADERRMGCCGTLGTFVAGDGLPLHG